MFFCLISKLQRTIVIIAQITRLLYEAGQQHKKNHRINAVTSNIFLTAIDQNIEYTWPEILS